VGRSSPGGKRKETKEYRNDRDVKNKTDQRKEGAGGSPKIKRGGFVGKKKSSKRERRLGGPKKALQTDFETECRKNQGRKKRLTSVFLTGYCQRRKVTLLIRAVLGSRERGKTISEDTCTVRGPSMSIQ